MLVQALVGGLCRPDAAWLTHTHTQTQTQTQTQTPRQTQTLTHKTACSIACSGTAACELDALHAPAVRQGTSHLSYPETATATASAGDLLPDHCTFTAAALESIEQIVHSFVMAWIDWVLSKLSAVLVQRCSKQVHVQDIYQDTMLLIAAYQKQACSDVHRETEQALLKLSTFVHLVGAMQHP